MTKILPSTNKNLPKLGPAQQQVLDMLIGQELNEKQIASKRRCTPRAVRHILKKLKEKGYINNYLPGGSKNNTPVSLKGFQKSKFPIEKQWRLHNLHFVLKPYYFYPRYHKLRTEKGNYAIQYKEWSIKLHTDTIEIQLQDWAEFSNSDKWSAIRMADESFNRTLREIQSRFGFEVWKDKKVNIKMVNHHLARNPSEIANARDGKYLFIKGHDGKIWFTIDKSKGVEHEYQHPERALTDSEKVETYFNDILYKQPPTNSELSSLIFQNAQQLQYYGKNIVSHVKAVQDISSGIHEFTKTIQVEIKGLKKDIIKEVSKSNNRFLSQPSRPQQLSQLLLTKYID